MMSDTHPLEDCFATEGELVVEAEVEFVAGLAAAQSTIQKEGRRVQEEEVKSVALGGGRKLTPIGTRPHDI